MTLFGPAMHDFPACSHHVCHLLWVADVCVAANFHTHMLLSCSCFSVVPSRVCFVMSGPHVCVVVVRAFFWVTLSAVKQQGGRPGVQLWHVVAGQGLVMFGCRTITC